MKDFLVRWYGERCPAWTWPVTIGAIAIAMLSAAAIYDHKEEQRCFAHGGNKSVASGCYSVTQTKIY